ncbi:MAG: hypothetical protein KGR26_15675, partial [Cyanobacteria bacterium REEB65]|nr:hypothetical protein [Cyanobacteria bacterium REEB65]
PRAEEGTMGNPALLPGDLCLYLPSPAIPGFEALAIGEKLAGIDAKYCHVGIYTGDGEISAYSDVGLALGAKYPYPCDVLRIGLQPEVLASALSWLRSRCGRTPYDWLDDAALWLFRRLNLRPKFAWPETSMTCSAAAAKFVRRCGLDPWPGYGDWEIAPGDFDGARGLVNVGRWLP